MNDLISLNVALGFSEKQISHIKEIVATSVADYPVTLSISQPEYIPHITVYQNEFYLNRLDLIENELKRIAKKITPFALKYIRISLYKTSNSASIWANVSYPQELHDLHFRLLSRSSIWLDDHVRNKFKSDSNFYNSLHVNQKESLGTYGHYLVGSQYEPHITLCRLDDGNGDQIGLLTRCQEFWNIYTFPVSGLSVYEGGPGGTCRRKLFDIPFLR